MNSSRRRVVITGMGAVGPLGCSVADTWQALLAGRSGLGPITLFDSSAHDVHVAGEASDFIPQDHISKRETRRVDRFSQFALAAASEAIAESGLDIAAEDTARIGVVIGTGIAGMPEVETQKIRMEEKGPGQVLPLLIPKMMANAPAANVAISNGLRGPNLCIMTACASGGHSLGSALRFIQYGEADVMLAGGTEACITPMITAGFINMGAMAKWKGSPDGASRPFDRQRCGFVIAEGAGVLVLEELSRAQKRGAEIIAEFVGYGMSGDGNHITAPDAGGDGGTRAILGAMADSGINPDEVDYINAHGTSTIANDKIETLAIKTAFGEQAYKIPISSTKSMTGHTLAAGGGYEAVVAVCSIRDDKIHQTLNLTDPDPACDLDYVPGATRERKVKTVLSNSLGFGGHNVTLAFKKFEG